MYTIYKITDLGNGKIYIGMTTNLKNRLHAHRYRLFRDKEFSCEILAKTKMKESAILIEKSWIEKLNCLSDQGYNQICGVKKTDELRKKMSDAQRLRAERGDKPFLGKKHSLETRMIMSQKKKGKIPPCTELSKIKTKNLDTGQIFDSLSEAAEKMGLHKSSISRVCLGKQKTAGGFHWSYV